MAYAAAGIANHDGTHVFALDAGPARCAGTTSPPAALHPQTGSGVSVNGHLLLQGQQLHLAGGNMVPVAGYDVADGKCVTRSATRRTRTRSSRPAPICSRSVDRSSSAGRRCIRRAGDYRMVNQGVLQTPVGDVVFAYGPHDGRVALLGTTGRRRAPARGRETAVAGSPAESDLRSGDHAPGRGAGRLAGRRAVGRPPLPQVVALAAQDGARLWSQALPAAPVPWGVLVDAAGRVVITLQDGGVVCYAGGK